MAIRFDLYNSSLCFVNSHLAAHVEEVERRNQDYLDICNRLVFSTTFPSKSIKDHDQVFWIGDLNYRLSGDLDLLRVKELLDQNNHLALLQYDQFRAQHAARKIFIGYQEGPIQFRPSYKYDPGTDNWDTSEKNRAPAWCDRCLWKGDNVQVKEYRSHPGLRKLGRRQNANQVAGTRVHPAHQQVPRRPTTPHSHPRKAGFSVMFLASYAALFAGVFSETTITNFHDPRVS